MTQNTVTSPMNKVGEELARLSVALHSVAAFTAFLIMPLNDTKDDFQTCFITVYVRERGRILGWGDSRQCVF